MSDYEPIELDWEGAELKPGLYEGTVKAVVSRREGQPLRSKDGTGDLMLKVKFSLRDERGKGAGDLQDVIMLGGDGMRMGYAKLRVLGLAKGENLVPDDLIGRRVMLQCKVDTFRDQETLKATKYLPLGADAPPPAVDIPAIERKPDGGDTPF